MTDVEKPDYATLRWVTEGLDETIHLARQGLERYVESDFKGEALADFTGSVHQILGTLRMVQAYGAAMLAEEMELIGKGLANRKIKASERLAESLMLGLVQLPNYLMRLEAGEPDVPLMLLPVINDLRATRNASPASTVASYAPNLDRLIEAEPVVPGTGNAQLPQTVKQLRQKYHKGLLLWYRDENSDQGLHEVLKVVQQVNAVAGTKRIRRLMDAIEALVVVLIEGEFTASDEVKRLFSRVDRVFKQLLDSGEEQTAEEFPRDLLKHLLYFVSRSHSQNSVVAGVKKDADLANSFPEDMDFSDQAQSKHSAGQEIVDAVKDVLLADINSVKDELDLYIRGDHAETQHLRGLSDVLDRIGDTLGMMGKGSLRYKLQYCNEKLNAVAEHPEGLSDDDLMSIATELVAVESALQFMTDQGEDEASEEDKYPLAAAARQKDLQQVVKEAFSELTVIKEAVEAYVTEPEQYQLMDAASEKNRQLVGVFQLAGLEDLSTTLNDVAPHLQAIAAGSSSVSDTQRGALIDLYAGVDYYLESYLDRRDNLEDVLKTVRNYLAIVDGSETVEPSSDDEQAPEQSPDAEEHTAIILSTKDIVAEPAASELSEIEDMVDSILDSEIIEHIDLSSGIPDQAQDEEVEEEAIVDMEMLLSELSSDDAESEQEVTAGEATDEINDVEEEVVSTATAVQLEEIDPEIFDIFMEEAEEELVVIQEQYPLWRADHDNESALQTFRRSFHTLKGSGRMVGALTIGEFAWSIEHLLNTAMEGRIATDERVIQVMDDAIETLPALIQGYVQGTSPVLDLADIQSRADALADGTAAPLVADSDVSSQSDEAEAPPPIVLVEDLYEIFSAESEAHLATIGNFIEQCKQTSCQVTDDLLRAIHTLRGSSHLAEVDSMAELSGAMEDYYNHLRLLNPEIDDTPRNLLQRFHTAMSDALHAINTAGAELPNSQTLLQDIKTAEQALPEIISELSEQEDQPPALDPDMVGIFLEEALDISESLENDFADWNHDAGNTTAIDGIKRSLHTLKGGARLAGLVGVGDLAHAMESLFESLEKGGNAAGQATQTVMRDALDELENGLDLVHLNGRSPDLKDVIATLHEEIGKLEQAVDTESLLVGDSVFVEDDNGVESILISDRWEEGSDLIEEPFLQAVPTQPAAGSEAESESPLDVDPEMLEIFLEEAGELVEQLEQVFGSWVGDLSSKDAIDGFMRNLHTIKGSARFAGLFSVGDLCHAMESLFENLASGTLQAEESMAGLIRRALDDLAQSVDLLQNNKPVGELETITQALEAAANGDAWSQLDAHSAFVDSATESILYKSTTQLSEETGLEEGQQHDSSFIADSKLLTDSELLADSPFTVETNAELIAKEQADNVIQFPDKEQIDFTRPEKRPPPLRAEEDRATGSEERVRVPAGLLDQLVNNAGEVSIYRARLEQQSNTVANNLLELNDTVGRLQSQLRALELETEAQVLSRHEREIGDEHYHDFDPLEMDRYSNMQQLSRALSETINDLSNIGGTLENLGRDTDTLLLQQARITNDLQDGLLRTRMVSFSQQVSRLQRVVRQTAQNMGKNANLEVVGAEEEIDRTILNRMMGPLEHLLRNAVAHGIEMPEQRETANKPEQGQVTLTLAREGTEIVISLNDDGAGLDAEAIREKAVSRGLLKQDMMVNEDALYQFILEPGFSTVSHVTQVAGRGVGMDAVVNEVKQLGGTLDIASRQGHGSSFVIRLPFTLAITEALLAKVADEIFAIPHGSAEIIVRATRQDLAACYSGRQPGIEYGGHEYPVRYLGTMLGLSEANLPSTTKWFPVLLVKTGEHRMAIQLDHLVGNYQIVVKSIGSQLSGVRWFTGGTILADGKVALLLDLNVLTRSDMVLRAKKVTAKEETSAVKVMVVDDSITVRKVTSRLLERHNMNVATAKDGVDAITVLQDYMPDVMLLDIEMPRMDGYELARHIRNTVELKHIPIIMITSRTGEKHRQKAIDLGVNRYLGKPFQEADLLDNIYTLLAEHSYE